MAIAFWGIDIIQYEINIENALICVCIPWMSSNNYQCHYVLPKKRSNAK